MMNGDQFKVCEEERKKNNLIWQVIDCRVTKEHAFLILKTKHGMEMSDEDYDNHHALYMLSKALKYYLVKRNGRWRFKNKVTFLSECDEEEFCACEEEKKDDFYRVYMCKPAILPPATPMSSSAPPARKLPVLRWMFVRAV